MPFIPRIVPSRVTSYHISRHPVVCTTASKAWKRRNFSSGVFTTERNISSRNLLTPTTTSSKLPLTSHWPELGNMLPLFSHVQLLCNPMGYSFPGPSVHGISQARILGGAAISFSRGSSRPRNQTQIWPLAGGFFITDPAGKPLTQREGKSAPAPDEKRGKEEGQSHITQDTCGMGGIAENQPLGWTWYFRLYCGISFAALVIAWAQPT